jgi:hypothetical protein
LLIHKSKPIHEQEIDQAFPIFVGDKEKANCQLNQLRNAQGSLVLTLDSVPAKLFREIT